MTELKHTELMTMSLTLDFANISVIGNIANGLRRIVPISGGNFTGGRLNGAVRSGADWVINRTDGVMLIDVRLHLITDDDANIYLSYQGRFIAQPDAMARLAEGRTLDKQEYSLAISAHFESGDSRYSWLNNIVAVGTGEQKAAGPTYTIFEVG